MSNKKNYIEIVVSVALVLMCFLGSIRFWCFYEPFYTSQHNSLTLYGNSIADHIGISDDDLRILTKYTLDYLNDYNDSLYLKMKIHGTVREVFNEDEKTHMVDVKKLYQTAMMVFYLSICVSLVFLVKMYIKKDSLTVLYESFKKVLLSTGTIIAILGSWILIDFDGFWTSFHHLFFMGNDLWLLDLRKDILIMIVPPQFFNNLVIRIVITFIVSIIVLYLILRILSEKEIKND